MIQPEFAHEPQMCDGCDAESTSAVWFIPTMGDTRLVLCPACIAALMFTAMNHPRAERMVDPNL